jgi:ribosomal protein S18 acetylase RimI-like enzyme
MCVTKRPALPSDTEFARQAHHAAYRDVVVRQFGSWDQTLQDGFFDKDWSGAQFQILQCDGVSCGYTSIEDHPDCIHVRELVLVPEFQRRGIGTAILQKTIECACARHVPVKLGVLHDNLAINLYRRLGFQECGRTDTHVLMEWNENQSSQNAEAARCP